jgi:hypothetical protein
MAAGPVWSDEAGGKHGLYRRHCAHCHGISGDGRGPTAMILNPYPRDYRPGVFKFKSNFNPHQPTDDDLRILLDGVPSWRAVVLIAARRRRCWYVNISASAAK